MTFISLFSNVLIVKNAEFFSALPCFCVFLELLVLFVRLELFVLLELLS